MREHLKHVDGHARMLVKPCEQGVMLKPYDFRVTGHGHGGRGARSTMRIEHRNLTQHFAVRMNAQQLHTSVGRLPDQFDSPAFQQIHAMIGVAFAENIVALVVFGMLQMRQQFLRLFGRNLLEQRGVQQRRAFATGSTIGLVWRSHLSHLRS